MDYETIEERMKELLKDIVNENWQEGIRTEEKPQIEKAFKLLYKDAELMVQKVKVSTETATTRLVVEELITVFVHAVQKMENDLKELQTDNY